MKKILVVAALMLSSVSTFAQHAVGSFNLQPKVGVSIANLTELKDTDPRVGVVAGVEGEYQASDIISVSAGVLYSMQGSKYEKELGKLKSKSTNKLDYINVPIMANVYVTKGLAVKLGVQPGFMVSGSENSKLNIPVASIGGTHDVKAKSVDFSIPVGLSYEYNNFQLDARYNWGLTKAFENGKAKNSVFQITLGYKFDL
ncbi:PorT family protein [Prevotella jejuni]|uniref:Outer membrane protein beta-barrel domain-containing protein n=1 Tax=Prevotella jejuni TaxID=1177574 RepID=A0A2K9HA30_9BACT|nr:porin family protein [Prevotella jejuni]AUI54577.1 PorT family protein [Prevotella jejuni]SNR89008.1 Outer membrane protein beta-barrel domain-containing protein [Prevotella jejuni]